MFKKDLSDKIYTKEKIKTRHKISNNKHYNFLFDWIEENNLKQSFYLFSLGFIIVLSTLLLISLRHLYDPLSASELNKDAKVLLLGYFGSGIITFTVQSNLILGTTLMVLAWKRNKWTLNVLFAAVVWISITFTIYWVLIAPSYSKDKWMNVWFTTRSLILHVIFPSIGFTILWMFRRHIIVMRTTRILIPLYLTLYYIFIIALFFGTLNDPRLDSLIIDSSKGEHRAVLIYQFANPYRPLYVNAKNTGILALMHSLAILLLYSVPFCLSIFWLKVYKLNYVQFFFKIKVTKKISTETQLVEIDKKTKFMESLKLIKLARANQIFNKY